MRQAGAWLPGPHAQCLSPLMVLSLWVPICPAALVMAAWLGRAETAQLPDGGPGTWESCCYRVWEGFLQPQRLALPPGVARCYLGKLLTITWS